MNRDLIRLAVKSPEYFPRLSYIALMQSVDVFVLADTFQYSRQSYQNRTRIRTPQGRHWISVPLVGRQHGQPVYKTQIDNRSHWRSKHQRAIGFNYSQTAYFAFIEETVKGFYDVSWDMLGNLSCQSISLIHNILQLRCRLVRASTLEGCPGSLQEVLEVMPASELITDYTQGQLNADVPCRVMDFSEPAYRQHFEGFEPNITVLDLICNYGPEAAGILKSGIQE